MDIIQEDLPLVDYSKPNDDLHMRLKHIDYNCLPLFEGQRIRKKCAEILEAFNALPPDPSAELPPILQDFRTYISECVSPEVFQVIGNTWPPVFPPVGKTVSTIIHVLIGIVKASKNPYETLKRISYDIIPKNVGYRDTTEYASLVGCCVCKKKEVFKKKDLFWGLFDSSGRFRLFSINDDLELKETFTGVSFKVNKQGQVVQINQGSRAVWKFVPLDAPQYDLWELVERHELPPLPMFFTQIPRPFPNEIATSILPILTSDDCLFLKALIHFRVSKVLDNTQLVEHLLTIFSYAKKVPQLLVALVESEFTKPSLTRETILRGNSHLTNVFKVFADRYGRQYYNDFLKGLLIDLDGREPLDLKSDSLDMAELESRLFMIIEQICQSGPFVPPEIRQLASILKSVSNAHFNNLLATYNTLNGFFILRFIMGVMVTPKTYDPELQLQHDPFTQIAPLTQLVQTPFNLQIYEGKNERFKCFNERLSNETFQKIVDFLFSLADIEQNPVYAVSTSEEVRQSIEAIVDEIQKSEGAFAREYKAMKDKGEPATNLSVTFFSCVSNQFELQKLQTSHP